MKNLSKKTMEPKQKEIYQNIQALKAKLAIDPADTIAHLTIGILYTDLQEYEQAKQHYLKAIEY